jgi:cytochrome c553
MKRGGAVLALLLAAAASPAQTVDADRGQRLFATPPASGLLACIDCHSETPQLTNFGNIWVGRHAPWLIERAVYANTGGMRYFGNYLSAQDFADIAAYLGTLPRRLDFPSTPIGGSSLVQRIELASSTKNGIADLQIGVEGDFLILQNGCGSALPIFERCELEVVARPQRGGRFEGRLLIRHADSRGTLALPLTGEAPPRPPATARLSQTALGFGAQPATRRVLLHNDSAETLGLLALDWTGGGDFQQIGGDCRPGLQLPGGSHCSLDLRYRPSAPPPHAATLQLRHDGQGGGETLQLSGSAPPQAIRLESQRLEIAQLPPGQTVRLPLRLFAQVDWDWQAPQASMPQLSLQAGDCTRLRAGDSCTAWLHWQPLDGQPAMASLLWPGGPQLQLRLRRGGLPGVDWRWSAAALQTGGEGVALLNRGELAALPPVLRLEGGSGALQIDPASSCLLAQPVPAGGACSLRVIGQAEGAASLRGEGMGAVLPVLTNPASLQLQRQQLYVGDVLLGEQGEPQSIAVRNGGAQALTWGSGQLRGDAGFRLLGDDCANPLPAGASCNLRLAFAPQRAGLHQARLLLPGGGLLQLRGEGQALAGLRTDLAQLDFGPLRRAQTAAPRRLTLRAWGAIEGLRWQTEGVFRASGCPASLAAGARCELQIEALAAEGRQQGRLRVLQDQRLLLDLPLSADWQSDGAQLVAEALPAPLQWRLRNLGNQASAPLRWWFSGAAARQYALAPDSECRWGQPLAPQAECRLVLQRQAGTAAGDDARWHGPQGGLELALASPRWQAAAVAPELLDDSLQFLLDGAPRTLRQSLFLHNAGTADWALRAWSLSGAGFRVEAGDCPEAPFVLIAGAACTLELVWEPAATAQSSAELRLQDEAGLLWRQPLQLRETERARSNEGASGGGALGPAALLLLLLAALALRRE